MPHPCKRALLCLAFLLSFLSFPFTSLAQPTDPALVRDINPGTNREERSGEPQIFIGKDGIVYFHNFDPAHGEEVWRTDGTAEGTFLFKDFLPGPESSYAGASTFVIGDNLYFSAYDGNGSYRLWKSDGTPAGTVPFLPGLEGPLRPFGVGDTLYLFRGGCRETSPCQLWQSDGTEAGTVKVADLTLPPGTFGVSPAGRSDGPVFYFKLYSQDDTLQELWRSDGTEAGTFPIRRFTGVRGVVSAVAQVGGILFFNGPDGLWTSDGTVAGTMRLKDVSPVDLKNVGGTLYFSGRDDASGSELWKSDGTEAGTVRVKDIVPGPESSHASVLGRLGTGEALVLVWRPETGYELWKSDGTEGGTVLVTDIVSGPPDDFIDWVTFVDGRLYLVISDGIHGLELWKSDGTAESTGLVKDIVPGPGSPGIMAPDGAAGKLFFWADDGIHGEELWKSDGTEAGTVPVKDIVQATSSAPALLTVSGDHLFFAANDGAQGLELWKTDGTEAGTVLAHDIAPGPASSYPYDLVDVDGILYFAANGETWRTDGTDAGLASAPALPPPPPGTRVGDALFFTVFDEASWTWSLWRSDGTSGGMSEIHSWSRGDVPHDLAAKGGALFFGLSPASGGEELWKSDSNGTVRVARVSEVSSPLAELTPVDGLLFFTAVDANGRELWRSDGTEGGTFRVADVYPGPEGSQPAWLTPAGTAGIAGIAGNGWLAFAATDPTHGREVWISDGTPAGTFLVGDVAPGARSSWPEELTSWNGRIYFSADDGTTGIELWSFEVEPEEPEPTDTTPVVEDFDTSSGPLQVGDIGYASVAFFDPDPGQAHFLVFDWGDGTESVVELPPGRFGGGATHAYSEGGIYQISVQVFDDTGRSDGASWGDLFVYDPDGPSVKAAGWIALPQGKATFQVDAGYEKGATDWEGEGKVRLKAPGVDFQAKTFSILVVNGPTAWLLGTGTFNGQQSFYWIALTDGKASGGDGLDRARIRITAPGGAVLFDNEPGKPIDARPTAVLGGGSIKLQTKAR